MPVQFLNRHCLGSVPPGTSTHCRDESPQAAAFSLIWKVRSFPCAADRLALAATPAGRGEPAPGTGVFQSPVTKAAV